MPLYFATYVLAYFVIHVIEDLSFSVTVRQNTDQEYIIRIFSVTISIKLKKAYCHCTLY